MHNNKVISENVDVSLDVNQQPYWYENEKKPREFKSLSPVFCISSKEHPYQIW